MNNTVAWFWVIMFQRLKLSGPLISVLCIVNCRKWHSVLCQEIGL